jgi:hypothetical protein
MVKAGCQHIAVFLCRKQGLTAVVFLRLCWTSGGLLAWLVEHGDLKGCHAPQTQRGVDDVLVA